MLRRVSSFMKSTLGGSGRNSLTQGEVTSQLQTMVSPEAEEQPTSKKGNAEP